MDEHHRKPLSVGHSVAGYSIVREIGRGGFGIVYEAVNPVTNDRVAIKQFYPQAIASWLEGTIVVKKSDDKELVDRILKRFEDEARLQFNFTHPNILKVRNFIRADNTGYLITEYIDGTSLADFLKPNGDVFPDQEAFRRTIEPVVDALGYVHARDVLHRDISPDNILIEQTGRPVLVDFGAAKLDLLRNPSVSSIVPYKEAYAPVEQQVPAAERPEGYYTDIYALAGTMYRAITGKPPARAIDRVLASKDPYVSSAEAARTQCSEAVYAAIDRGLALPAGNRPQSIAEFKQLLGWRTDSTHTLVQPQGSRPTKAVTVPKPTMPPAPESEFVGAEERASSGSDKRSNWKAYSYVALLVGGVAGGLWLSHSRDAQTLIALPQTSSETSLKGAPTPERTASATSAPKQTATPTPTPIQTSTPAPTPSQDSQAREGSIYQTALSCMRIAATSTCNIDYCLTPYRTNIGFENRYPELRSEYFKLQRNCSTPTPAPTASATPEPAQTATPTPLPVHTPMPIPTEDKQAREPSIYQTALSCMRSAASSTCNIDYCLTPYRSNIGFENRYPELRSEYFRLRQRCDTPSPTPTPLSTPTAGPTSTEDKQAREASIYQTALSCMRSAAASSCNIDYCLTPYRSNVGFENRYPDLRSEYFRLTQRCNTPTPTPSPSATAAQSSGSQAFEATLYQTALTCMDAEIRLSCNIDYCLQPYRTSIGFENRYPALRSEYFRLTTRCASATPTPSPTPVTPQPAPSPSPSYVTHENRDIDGGDLPGTLPHLRDVDQAACQAACNENAQCVGYSYGKWDKACYLKGGLPNLRIEPNSTAVIRSSQSQPRDNVGPQKIDATRRVLVGNRYSTSATATRQTCADLCLRETACLGYQYVSGACWRFDRIDSVDKSDSAQSGVKRQPAP